YLIRDPVDSNNSAWANLTIFSGNREASEGNANNIGLQQDTQKRINYGINFALLYINHGQKSAARGNMVLLTMNLTEHGVRKLNKVHMPQQFTSSYYLYIAI
ncbi:hypothetical protein ACJX0J_024066, partial [Zea mays]